MTSKTIGWLAAAFVAAAGIGSLPAGDPPAPAAGQGKGTAAPASQAAPAATATPAAPAVKGPDAGDSAPAFALTGSDGKTYTLADFKGKKVVVLAWFPKAFTGG